MSYKNSDKRLAADRVWRSTKRGKAYFKARERNRHRRDPQRWKRYYPNNRARRGMMAILEKQIYFLEWLQKNPCVDCREKDTLKLQPDHVRGKTYDVSYLIKHGKPALLKRELKKCVGRCGGCHAKRHFIVAGSFRCRPLSELQNKLTSFRQLEKAIRLLAKARLDLSVALIAKHGRYGGRGSGRKLSSATVRRIRKAYARAPRIDGKRVNGTGATSLAKKYKVSTTTMKKILKNKRYKTKRFCKAAA